MSMVLSKQTEGVPAGDRRDTGLTFKNSLRGWQARWKAERREREAPTGKEERGAREGERV
jgi:hypothetical protein